MMPAGVLWFAVSALSAPAPDDAGVPDSKDITEVVLARMVGLAHRPSGYDGCLRRPGAS